MTRSDKQWLTNPVVFLGLMLISGRVLFLHFSDLALDMTQLATSDLYVLTGCAALIIGSLYLKLSTVRSKVRH